MKTHTTPTTAFSLVLNWLNKNPFFSLIVIGLLIFSISSFKSEQNRQPTKVGVINLDYVVASSKSGKALQQQLEQFQRNVQTAGSHIQNEAMAVKKQLDEGASTLSQEQLTALQNKYEDYANQLRRYQEDKQREGEKFKNNGLAQIEKEMQPIVELLVKQEGIDVLLNNTPGLVIMANESVDLSQQMLALMNK